MKVVFRVLAECGGNRAKTVRALQERPDFEEGRFVGIKESNTRFWEQNNSQLGPDQCHGRPPYPADLMELFVAETKEVLKSGCSLSSTLVREHLLLAYDAYCVERNIPKTRILALEKVRQIIRSVDECAPTRITHEMKLPIDWRQQQTDMLQRIAVCMSKFKIPPELLFNIDESFTYLLPHGSTWATKTQRATGQGAPSIGNDDKRGVTLLTGFSATGALLPAQLIFQGETNRCHPDKFVSGVMYNHSKSHYVTTDTLRQYMNEIERIALNIKPGSKYIVLWDCCSVHKGKDFPATLVDEFPNMILLWVPACCTSVCQPCDVALFAALKSCLRKMQSREQLREWKEGKNMVPPVPLDMSIGHLREVLAACVGAVMAHLQASPKMVTNLVESWPKSLSGDMHDPVVLAAGTENLQRLFPNFKVPLPDGEEPMPNEDHAENEDDDSEFSEEDRDEPRLTQAPPSSRGSLRAPTKMTEETKTILRKGGWREVVGKLEELGFKSMADLKTLEEKDHKKLKLSLTQMKNFILFLKKPSVAALDDWLLK